MHDRPVAFIDSGIGGVPYLLWVRHRMPGENLVYCADTEHFPYGTKSSGEVKDLVLPLVERMLRILSPKMFVIACNTASVSALSALRAAFDVPFVGVVPAVKPAALISERKTIGIMATDRTVGEAYTEDLIRRFADGCTIMRYADGEIIDFVEHHLLDSARQNRERIVSHAVKALNTADTVVLACTHFIHLRDDLVRAFGPGVRIVDSVEGVGRQTIKVIGTCGRGAEHGGYVRFFITGGTMNDLYKRYAEKNGFEYMGILKP